MFVLENENEDPFQGAFVFRGQLTDETNKWAIDGTVFEHPLTNDLYFIWSGWEGDIDVMQVRSNDIYQLEQYSFSTSRIVRAISAVKASSFCEICTFQF
jgi:GH43 family beta-xylosidase